MEETEEPQLVSSDYETKTIAKGERRRDEGGGGAAGGGGGGGGGDGDGRGGSRGAKDSANGEMSQFTEVPLSGEFREF